MAVAKLDSDENPYAVRTYGVMSLSTLLVFRQREVSTSSVASSATGQCVCVEEAPVTRHAPAPVAAGVGAGVRARVVANEQGELLPAWRHHAVFTDPPLTLVQAEADHRRHAIIEQVIADLKNGPLAQEERPDGDRTDGGSRQYANRLLPEAAPLGRTAPASSGRVPWCRRTAGRRSHRPPRTHWLPGNDYALIRCDNTSLSHTR
jgi:hypothetical protein